MYQNLIGIYILKCYNRNIKTYMELMQAMKKHIDKYKLSIYILSTIIPIIVALIGLIKGGFAPFGNENVLGAS